MIFKGMSSNKKMTVEIEGDIKTIFLEFGKFQEIFDQKCGKCGSDNIHFLVRNATDAKGKTYKYYEARCMDCGATLAFGQLEDGSGLFPKRKDEEGNWLPDKGWVKWDKEKQVNY